MVIHPWKTFHRGFTLWFRVLPAIAHAQSDVSRLARAVRKRSARRLVRLLPLLVGTSLPRGGGHRNRGNHHPQQPHLPASELMDDTGNTALNCGHNGTSAMSGSNHHVPVACAAGIWGGAGDAAAAGQCSPALQCKNIFVTAGMRSTRNVLIHFTSDAWFHFVQVIQANL